MTEKSLADYCKQESQRAAAKILGCTPSAVSQMLAAEREIYIVENDDGELSSYEKAPVNKRNKSKAA